mgnify:CR=1 FL=1
MAKKKLCERVKKGQLKKKLGKYIDKVSDPEYICLKCGRVAEKKQHLCKPASLFEADILMEGDD